jgi:hypothetical protein
MTFECQTRESSDFFLLKKRDSATPQPKNDERHQSRPGELTSFKNLLFL